MLISYLDYHSRRVPPQLQHTSSPLPPQVGQGLPSLLPDPLHTGQVFTPVPLQVLHFRLRLLPILPLPTLLIFKPLYDTLY